MRVRDSAVIACVILGLAGAYVPASAERAVVNDRVGDDSGWGDIQRVEVDHGDRNVRVLIHQPPEVSNPDQFEVWVDTTPRQSGPDFVLFDYHGYWGSTESINRVDRWWQQDWGHRVSCRGMEMDRYRDRAGDGHLVMDFTIPRRCLGNPGKLRLVAKTAQEHMAASPARTPSAADQQALAELGPARGPLRP